jgi:hypothetical protein
LARQAASALKQLACCHLQVDETIVQFYQWLMETADCTEQMYGKIMPSVMVDGDKSSAKIGEKWKKAREKMIAILSMDGANKGFKLLLRELENDYVLGTNKYPATLAEALQVLMVYSEQPVPQHPNDNTNILGSNTTKSHSIRCPYLSWVPPYRTRNTSSNLRSSEGTQRKHTNMERAQKRHQGPAQTTH